MARAVDGTDSDRCALSGVRVLDVGLLVQGPHAGQVLNDLGADVVKIEMPGVGDYSRWIPVSTFDRRAPWFIACNRGKRSLCIDLRLAAGAELFIEMVKEADVVISNFLPGTMERWGLGYEELAAANAGIIYASASAFGSAADAEPRPGLDLTAQAASGLIHTTGPLDSAGYPVGVAIGDHLGGQNLAIGILAALLYRARTGRGQKVTTSLLGSLLFAQGPEITSFALSGDCPRPAGHGHHTFRTLYGVFTTADGAIAIAHVPETSRAAFWSAVGLAHIGRDSDFSGFLTRARWQHLHEVLDQALRSGDTDSWCKVFRQLGISHSVVRSYRQIVEDAASFDSGYLQRAHLPKLGNVVVPGSPIGLSESPARPGTRTPEVGEHSVEILTEFLGYTTAQIDRLRDSGVI